MRLKRALEEFVVEGMKTTIPLHQKLVRDPEFLAGDYTIKWLEQWLGQHNFVARLSAPDEIRKLRFRLGDGHLHGTIPILDAGKTFALLDHPMVQFKAYP
jgi:pyruvate carboxylase